MGRPGRRKVNPGWFNLAQSDHSEREVLKSSQQSLRNVTKNTLA